MIGIYCVINKLNNKRYVGKSVDIESRLNNHREGVQSNKHLQNSIKKYGINNFDFIVIEECDVTELDDKERYWIKLYNSNNPDYGYNKTNGAEFKSGFKMNYEERCKGARIAAETRKSRGYHHSVETIEKIRSGNIGKELSDDTKNKIRLSRLGKPISEDTKKKLREKLSGVNNPNYGKTLSQDRINDLIQSRNTDECRKKMSEAAKLRVGNKNPMYGKRGNNSPMYGRVSVTNGISSKFVVKSELDKYLSEGWVIGIDYTIRNNRRLGRSVIYHYDSKDFIGSYELLDYLHANGYPKISQNSVYKLSDNIPVNGYYELLGKITKGKSDNYED